METKHARLIRSAIEEAEMKADHLDTNFFWVVKRQGNIKDVDRYQRNAQVWDKRFNSSLWTEAYRRTIIKRGYILSGSSLYNREHTGLIERIFREKSEDLL